MASPNSLGGIFATPVGVLLERKMFRWEFKETPSAQLKLLIKDKFTEFPLTLFKLFLKFIQNQEDASVQWNSVDTKECS